ncbi:MAG: kelch repeat-containing protein [Breznakibacter sp.]
MIKISKWLIVLSFTIGLGSFTACSSDDDDDLVGNWVSIGDFPETSRFGAVVFTIGNYAYVGTGKNTDEKVCFSDFYRYDGNSWSEISNFPGEARYMAVAFSVNGKGYVGCGANYKDTRLSDFYEYDPELNTWTQINDFKGSARISAVAFSIGEYGYVGTGYDGNTKLDFYKYDPSSGEWSDIANISTKRRDAVAFVLNDKGYVVTGVNNGTYLKDFWEYNPETDKWTEKRKIADVSDESYDDDYEIVCSGAVSFTMGGRGYVATGGAGSAGYRTWEYNPTTDLWVEKSNFEGSPRLSAVGFSINDQGYVATGRSSGYYFDDVWSFHPNDEQNDDD